MPRHILSVTKTFCPSCCPSDEHGYSILSVLIIQDTFKSITDLGGGI